MTDQAPQDIRAQIERCWRRGDSIGECRLAVQRAISIKPAAHEVQRIYAELAQ